jgi:hypothetical protein
MRARLAFFRRHEISEHDMAALSAVLIWALHANTAAALFWTAAHIYAGARLAWSEAIFALYQRIVLSSLCAEPPTLAAVRAEVAAAGGSLAPTAIAKTDLDAALPLLTSAVSGTHTHTRTRARASAQCHTHNHTQSTAPTHHNHICSISAVHASRAAALQVADVGSDASLWTRLWCAQSE